VSEIKYPYADHVAHYVRGPGVVAAVAVNVFERDGKRYIGWYDPARSRVFQIRSIIADSPTAFEFRDKRGLRFRLVPMTPENYAKHVGRRIVGAPALRTQKALDRWFTPEGADDE
jgi:hypothetical protein